MKNNGKSETFFFLFGKKIKKYEIEIVMPKEGNRSHEKSNKLFFSMAAEPTNTFFFFFLILRFDIWTIE